MQYRLVNISSQYFAIGLVEGIVISDNTLLDGETIEECKKNALKLSVESIAFIEEKEHDHYTLEVFGNYEIYLERNETIVRLLARNTKAEGRILPHDKIYIVVNTTEESITHVQNVENTIIYFEEQEQNVLEEISSDSGTLTKETESFAQSIPKDKTFFTKFKFTPPIYLIQNFYLVRIGILLLIVFFVMVYGFSFSQKGKAWSEKSQQITLLLQNAKESAIINPQKAQSQYNEAESLFNTHKNLATKTQEDDIKKIESLFDEVKNNIIKRSSAQSSVFFDFSLDDKGFIANSLYKKDADVVISGTANKLYKLTLPKKSLKNITTSEPMNVIIPHGKTYIGVNGKTVYDTVSKKIIITLDNVGQDICSYNNALYIPIGTDLRRMNYIDETMSNEKSYFISPPENASITKCFITSTGQLYILNNGVIERYGNAKKDTNFKQDTIITPPSFNQFTVLENGSVVGYSSGTLFIYNDKGEYKEQKNLSLKETVIDMIANGNSILLLTEHMIFEVII